MTKSHEQARLVAIPIDTIDTGAQLIRHDPNDDDIIELAASISEVGLLEPIGVAHRGHGRYELLYGNRRLTAYKRLKRPTIPAMVSETPEADVKTVAIVENLQRAQLTLAEEIDAVTHLHNHQSLSPDQIAVRLSKSRGWVLRRLAIPQLPLDLSEPLLTGRLSLGSAEELANLEDESIRRYATNQALQAALSQSQVREMVQGLRTVDAQPQVIEAAVEKGRQVHTAPDLRLTCQHCNTLQPVTNLLVVRICKSGCHDTTPPPLDPPTAT